MRTTPDPARPRTTSAPLRTAIAALLLAGSSAAPAQGIPVIDVTAVTQLMQQVTYWTQQINAMANQLAQLRQTYQAMTGQRPEDTLLPITTQQRNYLPDSLAQLDAVFKGNSTDYPALTASMQRIVQANAILTQHQLSVLSPQDQATIQQARQAAAMLNALTQQAYGTTSQRFALLQQLIDAIRTANDPKAVDDLQARVNAEQAMLTNEQTKLQVLYQLAQAQDMAQREQVRERVVTDHGAFAARFEPHP